MQSPSRTTDEGQSRYPWYVLGLLVCVYMLHHLDRMVITLLQEPIKAEFRLSDGELGLISGTAYAIAFGAAGLPLGLLADRVRRVPLLALLFVIWSGLTALASTASSYLVLFLIRIGVGAAESGGTPTNLSLLSDYFPGKGRSTAVGIYMMGPQIGTLIGFALTGIVAAAHGWRAALLFAGVPGLILAILVLMTVREPPRQATQRRSTSAFQVSLFSPLLIHLIAGVTLSNVVAPGLGSWLPSLLIRTHHVGLAEVGMLIAFTVAPVAIIATVLAGLATDRLTLANQTAQMVRWMAGAAFLTVPCVVVGVLTDRLWLAMTVFAIQHFLHMFISTPGYALAMHFVPAQMRGTTAALLQVLSNLIGFGLGPMIVGALSDALRPSLDAQSLRYAMALFVLGNLWTCGHLIRASVLLARDASAGEPAAGFAPRPRAAP